MNTKQKLKNIFFKIKPLKILWSKLSLIKTRLLLRFNPKSIANSSYRSVFKRDINWDGPIDLIEKIQWLQLYSDTSLWTLCADKYLVRDFVIEKGCGDVLNELYGKWEDANDIEWSKLPESFVLKANHSCGQVILVNDKNKLDKSDAILQMNDWMKTAYGYSSAQLHYTRIKPCIIAEKLFVNKEDSNKSLIDYKIWCIHGVPECVLVVYNRTVDNYSLSLYDMAWNNISHMAFNKNNKHFSGVEVPKPLSLNKMIEVAKKLSEDFAQVRVDFYDINEEAVFGELTFTTGFGYFSDEYYKYLGSKIDLDKVNKRSNPNFLPLFK